MDTRTHGRSYRNILINFGLRAQGVPRPPPRTYIRRRSQSYSALEWTRPARTLRCTRGLGGGRGGFADHGACARFAQARLRLDPRHHGWDAYGNWHDGPLFALADRGI